MTTTTCTTCGTQILRDDETGAEVHFDVTYKDCGVEGELRPLADHIDGTRRLAAPKPTRHLSVVN